MNVCLFLLFSPFHEEVALELRRLSWQDKLMQASSYLIEWISNFFTEGSVLFQKMCLEYWGKLAHPAINSSSIHILRLRCQDILLFPALPWSRLLRRYCHIIYLFLTLQKMHCRGTHVCLSDLAPYDRKQHTSTTSKQNHTEEDHGRK